MIFSVTERGTFRRCKQQALYTSKNAMHLTPMFSPLSLSLGSLMHHAFQKWLGDPSKTFESHTMEAGIALRDKAVARYVKQVGMRPSEGELSNVYEAIDFGLAMSRNYQIKWGSALPDGYRLIQAEIKVEVEVPGTEHPCEMCSGSGWRTRTVLIGMAHAYRTEDVECPECHGEGVSRHKLAARLDALFQHIKTGRYDIDEHKTYKNRPNETTIRYNDQFISYIWQVLQLKLSDQDPQILYDGMWRRAEVPKKATFDDLFARYTLTRTRSELEQFARQLPHELNDMYALYTRPETAYLNRPWMGCYDCQMSKLCYATSRGEDTSVMLQTDYTQRDDDVEEEEETDV